jgi:pimeloyl-ACP methyl ester carboxylesterase
MDMDYIKEHNQLVGLFSLDKNITRLPDSVTAIHTFSFASGFKLAHGMENQGGGAGKGRVQDQEIQENFHFRYPVFMPGPGARERGMIILLHGLNERSWDKYLVWGKYLAEETGKGVLLFPLAFHVNRGKKEWKDPRGMKKVALEREHKYHPKCTTFMNVALSERLTEDPARFFKAGLQSAFDLISLIRQIKQGDHPLFGARVPVDFFGYSIGALLTQVMLMANPDRLLENSRAVLFCGGTPLGLMSGISKFILDEMAFQKVVQYYQEDFEHQLEQFQPTEKEPNYARLTKSFLSMIPVQALNRFREGMLSRLSGRIMAIGLQKDHIVPAKNIQSAAQKFSSRVRILDFPYPYSHENPFPVQLTKYRDQVSQCFLEVFGLAAKELA